jgi:radical SAM protein with 4Fe4S-binding SPASM domain
MSFEGFPHIVGWELTLACNLRCRHCASAAGLPRPDELTTDEALALVDQFPALLVRELHFTGGEPLMRPDWPRIAERAAERGLATRVVTNGSPLVPAVIEQIRDVGIGTVGISLDGLEATHDHVRQRRGLFRRVLAAIERLHAAGLRVGVITAVNARNLAELPDLLELLTSMGVESWQLQPNLPQGRSEEATDLHLEPRHYLELGAFFRSRQAPARQRGLEIVPADSLGYFTELDLAEPPWRGCPAGLYSVGITSDGRVKGCLTMPDTLTEGSLREADLWEIWFRDGAFPYTRGFSLDQMGPHCRGCEWAEQCRGGCTSMSKVCSGAVHDDPFCYQGIQRRHPGLLETVMAAAGLGAAPAPPEGSDGAGYRGCF